MARLVHFRIVFFLLLVCLQACISYRERPTKLFTEVVQHEESFDAGIVPGVPFKNGQWDSIMKGRVLWAVNLYQKGIIRNIIFSGGAVYSPYFEAKIMSLYAQEMGVPVSCLFSEIRVEHSTENIYYSYELARQQGFKSIALVTDPFQSSLTKRFTRRRFATHIQHIPFMVDTIRKLNHVEYAIDPSSAYAPNFKSLTERENGWKRFRGTLGAFIPWENRKGRKATAL
ncbi:MAG TPA: YdcF family protein [Niabella sp.]|nr:YdcF family protein [Niabella sp.]HQW15119.1 YdcF family protein [Niabella sp.]HQX20260.1 YdcF family protein [Niabella sp.]HQX41589.1 YdcF family protein [Niabella sp.]HRB07381.1 YdcF family protein [Niabella sp.]